MSGFAPSSTTSPLEQGLTGWVLNASDGVYTVVEGDDATVDAFPQAIRDRAPAMAVIETIVAEEVEPEGFRDFSIRASRAEEGAMTLVSPDIATCPECAAELFDPSDRRYRYPFINCTNCGPRFTIIGDVPYDRPMTSMRDFPMCPECAEEYGDPRDRRFHAQPDACFICGPRLYLNAEDAPYDWQWTPEREASPRPHRDRDVEAARSDAILAARRGTAARRSHPRDQGPRRLPPRVRRHQPGSGRPPARAQAPLGQAARDHGARRRDRPRATARSAPKKRRCSPESCARSCC